MEISLVVRNNVNSRFSRSKQRRSLGKELLLLLCVLAERVGGGAFELGS